MRATLILAAAVGLIACSVRDPEADAYQCTQDSDCGSAWQCARAPDETLGTCGKICVVDSECTQSKKLCAMHAPPLDATDVKGICLKDRCNPRGELCDGIDNDCDGTVDDGTLCSSGSACTSGACVETQCDDGSDNDRDGATDCGDIDCNGAVCGAARTCVAGICAP